MTKTIVLISVFFPPERHIAVSRIEAYAKYLSLNHHKVIVITLGDKDSVENYNFNNQSLCKVYYVSNHSMFDSLLSYSGKESWLFHKIKTLIRVIFERLHISRFGTWSKKAKTILCQILSQEKVDVLISSYAPEDVLEISYQSLNLLDNKSTKWVLDMRDEYSEESNLLPSLKEYRQKKELEYSSRADLIIAVSKPALEMFKVKIPIAGDYLELRNGFDHDFISPKYIKSSVLRIGYFGSFYGDIKPDLFFKAIIEEELHNKVEIFFATRNVNFNIPSILKERITFFPYMSYNECIQKMSSMDVNLLILPKNRQGVFSGKIFDYLSVKRTILAIINPNDVAAHLINECNAGYIADFNNLENIKLVIRRLYEDWENGKLVKHDVEKIGLQHRKYQVQKLNEWVNKL